MTLQRSSWWFTATEIAALGLPGLPETARQVRDWATAQGWAERTSNGGAALARLRRAKGGGTEYHASLLPLEAQNALTALSCAEEMSPTAANDQEPSEEELWSWYEQQTSTTKSKAAQRLAILSEVESRVDGGTTSKTAAIDAVAQRHAVSSRAIASWFSLVADKPRSQWLPRLAPQYHGGGKEVEIDPEAWRILRSDYLRPEKPSFAACYRRLVEDYASPRGIALPSAKTLERRLKKETSKALKKAKRDGREALRRTVPPIPRTVADLHAMKAVNADGHKFDVFVRTEDGRIIRPLMVAIQDIYSRKLLAHRIGESESSQLIRATFADLFSDYGIPWAVLTDNGRAFASKDMTGGSKTRFRFKINDDDTTGVLVALGINIKWALPYRGSSKPIERAFRDLCEDIAKHPAMAGAYTGNRPDAKPENYRARAIPIAEFRAHVARQIAAHNARTGRRTEMANGGSFDEAFAASYAVSPIGKASAAQLRLALLLAEERRCHREDGSVMLAGNRYWSSEMGELAGEKVVVRYDPENLHSEIHIYDSAGRYFGAAPVIQKTGFFDQAGAVRRAKLEQNVRRSFRKAEKDAGLLRDDQLAEIYSEPSDPAPKPNAGVVRPVRHRGNIAAALKPIEQASSPAEPAFIDAFAAGASRLRAVE